jgi:hypothetical protein
VCVCVCVCVLLKLVNCIFATISFDLWMFKKGTWYFYLLTLWDLIRSLNK